MVNNPISLEGVLGAIFDIAPSPKPTKGQARSSEWPAVQRAFIAEHPRCEVCGRTKKLNAHHIIPFEYGGPELDPNNLITLCRGTFNCHLLFGHLGDYKGYNPLVRADAETWRFRLRTRRIILRLLRQKGIDQQSAE